MDFSRWEYRFVSWFFDKPDACFEMAKNWGCQHGRNASVCRESRVGFRVGAKR